MNLDPFAKFWKYNKYKIFYKQIIIALFLYLCVVICGYTDTRTIDLHILNEAFCYLLVYVLPIYLLFDLIWGVQFFRTISHISTDTSEKSILSLFDDGIHLELENDDSRIFYTKEYITGNISGLPVTIKYFPGGRFSQKYMEFSFFPLLKDGSKEQLKRSTTFRLNIFNKFNVDIKPIVRDYVSELIGEGYTSGFNNNHE